MAESNGPAGQPPSDGLPNGAHGAPPNRGTVAIGALLTLPLHLLQLPLAVAVGLVACGLPGLGQDQFCGVFGLAPPLFIGVTQLVYIIPAVLMTRRRGRTALAQGLLIGAAITFLLNAACWGMLTFGQTL